MYWPYLRNRTNELFAIKEIAKKIAPGRLVIPVFHLIDLDKNFKNRALGIAKLGQRFSILVNANAGVTVGAAAAFLAQLELEYPGMALPGIEIKNSTSITEVQSFSSTFAAQQCVVVHREPWAAGSVSSYLSALALPPVNIFFATVASMVPAPAATAGNVILTDGFQRQLTNGAYPPRSAFANHVFTHYGAGYQGFGDFAAIGDYYKKGGGQASHVALHLTEFSGTSMVCNHFVSHATPVAAHIKFKYYDSRDQLRSHATPLVPGFHTTGVTNYHGVHDFRGLGMPKRWSLKHHVELMHDFLVSQGRVPFV